MLSRTLSAKTGVLRSKTPHARAKVLFSRTPGFAQPARRLSAIQSDFRVLEAKTRRFFLWRVLGFFFALSQEKKGIPALPYPRCAGGFRFPTTRNTLVICTRPAPNAAVPPTEPKISLHLDLPGELHLD